MKLIGILPARNEGWCIGLTVRALLLWCDEVIVLDHASTDDTRVILRNIAGTEILDAQSPHAVPARQLSVLSEPSIEWREMEHRQRLLEIARKHRATHVAIVDADEMLTGNLLPHIRRWIEATPPHHVLSLPWICAWRAADQYRCDQFVRTNDTASVAFPLTDDLYWQAPDGYQHHHREPYNTVRGDPTINGVPNEMKRLIAQAGGGKFSGGGLIHFQFADRRRLEAKHALYKMNELVRWPGRMTAPAIERMYNPTLCEDGLKVQPMPADWLAPYQQWMKHLHLGVEPWHVAECRRLWQEKGPAYFRGLDLFGVIG